MTGLIWDAVLILLGVFCLLIAVTLTCIAAIFTIQFFSAAKKLLKKGKERDERK